MNFDDEQETLDTIIDNVGEIFGLSEDLVIIDDLKNFISDSFDFGY